MKIDEFEIRSYSKTELALLYNPQFSAGSARRLLRRWIHFNKALNDQLRRTGLLPNAHVYTPLQVKMIVEHLGAP
jgi:hypothetical protein